ncbi:MAG: acyltransferase [Clostridiales bacterium]|nr:acyltransferase [Clostridiales bacterium]
MQKVITHLKTYQEAPNSHLVDVLDGFRALCVLLVGWFHIWQQGWLAPSFTLFGQYISLDFLLRSGYIWVDGLLLISGFLLYLPYTLGKDSPAILPFYKKRLIRILPSYLLCIIPLFIQALVNGAYPSAGHAVQDLLSHLTFTHNLFPYSYHNTPLNGALWTLGVEMQFYLIFPFLARAFRKHGLITYLAMTGAAFAFRAFSAGQGDTSMYFNQLPAFLDVYANGFMAASVFSLVKKKMGKENWDWRVKAFFTALFFLCICHLVLLAKEQAAENGYESIRRGQMNRRFVQSAVLACAVLCACFSLSGLRFLMGNPLMRFFSAISFQFYIYHQMLAVNLKTWGFPPSDMASPWMGDYRWQLNYTLCCFIGAIILASLITFLFERPIARRLRRNIKEKNNIP